MQLHAQSGVRMVQDFNKNWLFNLGDTANGQDPQFNDARWRRLNLPHDWSIEGKFDKSNPATPSGGALPGGIGWYRKTFTLPPAEQGKLVHIEFDGIYQHSDVWLNGHHLSFVPYGYSSFIDDLTPYLKFGGQNVIAVKVDNSQQPNSRWYSGSGIYRNVKLIIANKISVDDWGVFVTTPQISATEALVHVQTSIRNFSGSEQTAVVTQTIYNAGNQPAASAVSDTVSLKDTITRIDQSLRVKDPRLWSIDQPYLYKVVTTINVNGKMVDRYETTAGVRHFNFDADNGFSLNGKPLKILGVCNHHDLGALGAAINTRALERQLSLLKAMGCNAIRTSHNPPAPELLDLCDKMGFIVMDEAFDMWNKQKTRYDYHLYFKEWHERDIVSQVLRDRNHPSVMIWSIGNEIPEQTDSTGFAIAQELAAIIHRMDTTRPLTAANNNPDTRNQIIRSGALDLIGYNYHHNDLPKFHDRYPGKKFIGTETTSAFETRGFFQMPSDSIYRWTSRSANKNSGMTASSYDQVSAAWGSTHEETWKIIKKYDFLSGMFIWTGFDYLGEPTPYPWPARSSYFGIIDLAGFPKDVYYMYQSEWTSKPVLHLLPHWNWQAGETVDVWAYYNQADEVELFLNGRSLGVKKKENDDLHVMWRVKFEPGTLKAISRKNGKTVLTTQVKTAGPAARIELIPDRRVIRADGRDLSFITVKIVDKDGTIVPDASNPVNFTISGGAFIAAVDNGDPTSLDSFRVNYRKAFHGLALAIVQAKEQKGNVTFTATADGLAPVSTVIQVR